MSYLIAVPGFKQIINKQQYRIVRMFSDKQQAAQFIDDYIKLYRPVKGTILLYERKKQGKLFGRHPYCIAIKETSRLNFKEL